MAAFLNLSATLLSMRGTILITTAGPMRGAFRHLPVMNLGSLTAGRSLFPTSTTGVAGLIISASTRDSAKCWELRRSFQSPQRQSAKGLILPPSPAIHSPFLLTPSVLLERLYWRVIHCLTIPLEHTALALTRRPPRFTRIQISFPSASITVFQTRP